MSSQFNLVEYVQNQRDLFLPVISDESISFDREAQFAIQSLQKNDYLAKIATSNTTSLQNAIINVAAIGITLNPASKLAYLVPRDGGVCLDISYMGLLHIAQQSGSIMWGQCKLVYSNDSYVNQGLSKEPVHEYKAFGDRGSVVGGYCTVKTIDGDFLTEEMSLDEIKQVQNTSKAKSGPWKSFWNEMARKTIVKRASKYWPKVDRLDRAIDSLNTDLGEGLQDAEIDTKPELIINVDDHIKALCEKQGKELDNFFEWLSKSFKRDITCFDDMSEEEKQFIARKLEGKA